MHTTHSTVSEELIGDDVRVAVQKKSHCQVEFLVKATKNLVQKARLNAVKVINKEVALPGFRKGKAPDAMILSKYPHDVERRLHKELADLAFVEAQKLAKVPVLNNNSTISFDLVSQDESGAELKFVFETEPVVPSVDPKLFVPKPVERKEVGEKQVNEAIRQMSFFYAKWELIEDRPVQEGDFIIIDLDTVDGDSVQRVFNQVRFEVVPERMANWMRNLVLNAKIGDVVEGVSEPDDTATEEEKKEFKPKKVRLHVLKVERAILPEMDDEFAKKVGAKDVAGMHELVLGVLQRQVEDKAQNDLREQVNDFLVTQYFFDLPRSLVEAEYKHRYSQGMRNPEFKNHMENATPEQKKKIEDRIREETDQSLRLFYLSKQIVQDAKIPITHNEVQQRAVAQRRANPMGMDGGEQIAKEEFALALSTVFLTKAQDFIINSQKA